MRFLLSSTARVTLLLALGLCLAVGQAQTTDSAAEDDTADAQTGRQVYVIQVEGLISNVMLTSIQRRVELAQEAGADLIVLEIDTYGGLVTSALEIGTYIKNLDVETLAWVNDKAISAGAMISVAADGIVMAERSRIGDSAPIAIGQQLEGTERAKIESPILEEFRDSARRNGYPVVLTEAMVRLSPAIYQIENTDTEEVRYVYTTELDRYGLEPLREEHTPPTPEPSPSRESEDQPSPFPGLSLQNAAVAQADADTAAENDPPQAEDETDTDDEADADATERVRFGEGDWQILKVVNPANTLVTLSQDEAIEYGFARRIIADDQALMAMTNATDETFHRLDMSWSENLANLLVSPGVRSVLMILLLLGAYMEFQSPGLGVPGAVAAVALVLMIGAPFIAGLADMTDILIIAAGLILIGIELFLLPGIGVAGILGVLLVLVGFLMTFVPPDPEPGWVPTLDATWLGLRQGLLVMILGIIVTGIAGFFLARHIDRVPLFRRLVLESTVDTPTSTNGDAAAAAMSTTTDDPDRHITATAPAAEPPPLAPGSQGRALTGLRPAGRIEVDGQIVDVVTGGRWVEAGESVRIVEIHGNRVVVEQA